MVLVASRARYRCIIGYARLAYVPLVTWLYADGLLCVGRYGPAKSTDRDKLTTNKLTANQRFHHPDFVTKLGFGQDGPGDSKIFL